MVVGLFGDELKLQSNLGRLAALKYLPEVLDPKRLKCENFRKIFQS